MQIALSLGLGVQTLGETTPGSGPVLPPPSIDLLVVDPQTPEGVLPIRMDVSVPCTVHYVLSGSVTAPSLVQIAAGQDHTGTPAPDGGSVVTSDITSYNAPQAPSLVSGSYYIHAYPINRDGTSIIISFGPFTVTRSTS